MNKIAVISVSAFVLCAGSVYAHVYSRSYLTMRSRFELAFPERIVMFRDRAGARENGHDIALQAVVFGGQTADACDIARYFLPNDKDYIIVGGDASACAVNLTRDVNAAHFGILTFQNALTEYDSGFNNATFESRVDFCPKQTSVGIGFTLQHRLSKGFWWDIAFPITHIRNTMGLKETVYQQDNEDQETDTCNYVHSNFTESITCDSKRMYGNIYPGWMKKTGIPQVEVRIGRDVTTSACVFGSYVGLTVPTGNKPCARYMFEPVLGNNQHWGCMLGAYGAVELMRDSSDRTINALFTSVTRFLAPNTQRRSFDLKSKPWSRYMLVWTDNNAGSALTGVTDLGTKTAPLINYTTMCVSVHPHYNYDFNFGLNYSTKRFRAEAGYNLYARNDEDIYFNQPMKSGIGVAGIKRFLDSIKAAAVEPPYTNSLATIASPVFKLEVTNAGGRADEVVNTTGKNTTPAYVPITIDDLNTISGSCPATLAQTIYGALGFMWDMWDCPFFTSAGVAYEFASNNTTPDRWTAWFKLGVSV